MGDYTNEQVEALCWKIENLQAEAKMLNARIIKQRGEILQLKSHIGNQNILIGTLQNDKERETIDITYEETD